MSPTDPNLKRLWGRTFVLLFLLGLALGNAAQLGVEVERSQRRHRRLVAELGELGELTGAYDQLVGELDALTGAYDELAGAVMPTLVNRDSWERLTDDQKIAVRTELESHVANAMHRRLAAADPVHVRGHVRSPSGPDVEPQAPALHRPAELAAMLAELAPAVPEDWEPDPTTLDDCPSAGGCPFPVACQAERHCREQLPATAGLAMHEPDA